MTCQRCCMTVDPQTQRYCRNCGLRIWNPNSAAARTITGSVIGLILLGVASLGILFHNTTARREERQKRDVADDKYGIVALARKQLEREASAKQVEVFELPDGHLFSKVDLLRGAPGAELGIPTYRDLGASNFFGSWTVKFPAGDRLAPSTISYSLTGRYARQADVAEISTFIASPGEVAQVRQYQKSAAESWFKAAGVAMPARLTKAILAGGKAEWIGQQFAAEFAAERGTLPGLAQPDGTYWPAEFSNLRFRPLYGNGMTLLAGTAPSAPPPRRPARAERAEVGLVRSIERDSNPGQCHAITRKGWRCSRNARSGGYCWQHGG